MRMLVSAELAYEDRYTSSCRSRWMQGCHSSWRYRHQSRGNQDASESAPVGISCGAVIYRDAPTDMGGV